MSRCAARALLVASAALAAGACRATPAATPHEVRYTLAWTTSGDGSAEWETTSDLGYRVHVTRGWVSSYGMELVECPKAATLPVAHRLAAAAWSLLETPAWAGHLSGTPNPAAIHPMLVESLTDSATGEAGRVTLAPQAYCQMHYLVARAGPDAVGLPAAFDMRDTTLHVEGRLRAPGASAETPFTIHTGSAYGQLFDRVAGGAPLRVDPGQGAVEVIVRRDRGRLFDGVDFAHMAERQQGLQALKALVNHAQIELRTGNAPG